MSESKHPGEGMPRHIAMIMDGNGRWARQRGMPREYGHRFGVKAFQTILEHSGVNKYFYDENGNFVKKEKYDDCLLKYFEVMDEKTGLYPLTEDLKYIIQSRGEYSGWFDTTKDLYLFKDENGNKVPGINEEISWLFFCCY